MKWWGSWFFFWFDLGGGSQYIDNPASTHMDSTRAAVGQDVGVIAAGVE